MSFTCSWDLVEGSLDEVFGLNDEAGQIRAATFEPTSQEAGPCEFMLNLEGQDPVTSFNIACNARLCELYTRRLLQTKAKPSYAGSVASTDSSNGRRLLTVQLSQAMNDQPTLLILRMMHPAPNPKRFNLFSWLSSSASETSASTAASEVVTASPAVGMSQADAIRQMLEALKPGQHSDQSSDRPGSIGAGLASLMAAASQDTLRTLTPQSTESECDLLHNASAAELSLHRREQVSAQPCNSSKKSDQRQQWQHPLSTNTQDVDGGRPSNPMQAVMGSIGTAMLLKERKLQIAAQQAAASEVVGGSSGSHTCNFNLSGSDNHPACDASKPLASPSTTDLQCLMQQLLANQKAAAEQHAATTAAMQALTATMVRLQAGQEVLTAHLTEFLGRQATADDALPAATLPR